jgi:hypothetical protein
MQSVLETSRCCCCFCFFFYCLLLQCSLHLGYIGRKALSVSWLRIKTASPTAQKLSLRVVGCFQSVGVAKGIMTSSCEWQKQIGRECGGLILTFHIFRWPGSRVWLHSQDPKWGLDRGAHKIIPTWTLPPMLNPTYEPWPWRPRVSDFFSWRMGFAKLRSVKYDFDLYERLFKEKWPNFVRFQNPKKIIIINKNPSFC